MPVNRQTIIFFLPLGVEALSGNSGPYSEEGSPVPNAGGQGASWDRRQLYMNPQTFNIRDQKLIQKTLTKGGHMVQYWGEDLTTIDAGGTTGSAGIEGINILKDIYRHEQLHYRTVLANRQRELAAAAALAQAEAEEQIYDDNIGGALLGIADGLTGGAVSKTVKGVSNTIDVLFGTSLGSNSGGTGGSFQTVPTLAAFATNIDMYFQGEFFRGYFTSFTVSETAQEPGHFTYQFQFVVTRRSGKRDNFMPWHRNPVGFDGETLMSQNTTEAKGAWPGVERLSFLPDKDTWATGLNRDPYAKHLQPGEVESEFIDEFKNKMDAEDPPNAQDPVRRNAMKK